MQDYNTEQELRDRLTLIENMIAEGRSNTESWGWAFVLWGAAYYVAIAWSALRHSAWAWPATVSIAVVFTLVVALRKPHNSPATTLGRAIGSIWTASGISMSLLFLALGFSGRLTDQRLFLAVISAILGMANGASALILRWKTQLACACVWWAVAVAMCFTHDPQSTTLFLIAIFLCQILFGIHAMTAEAQSRKQRDSVHA
jgi:hypothetical protein